MQYVTGSGQTQPTRDRVAIYEKEGNVTPVKRLLRKTKKEMSEIGTQHVGRSKKSTKKKPTYVKKKSVSDAGYRGNAHKTIVVRARSSRRSTVQKTHSPSIDSFNDDERLYDYGDDYTDHVDLEEETEQAQQYVSNETGTSYLPLPSSLSLMIPPVPMRRTESSFSQAAALISSNQGGASIAPASYLKSPKECYFDVDVDSKGIQKCSSANWSSVPLSSPRDLAPSDDHLRMLREVSEDSDLSGGSGPFLPSHLMHQTSGTLEGLCLSSGSIGSPSLQPRPLERIHSSSLEHHGEVDMDLLEKELRNDEPEQLWMSRTTSASSLSEGLSVNG